MHRPNTMYSPHRKVTPVIQAGVTIQEIESELRKLLHVSEHAAEWEMRPFCLWFAILKEGISILKLEAFTGYSRQFLLAQVETLRAQAHLYTGTLSNQFLLHHVPGCEALIERITGQRIPKQESTNMSKVEPGAAAEAALEAASAKPKRKYKKRESKKAPGDGTLRIKKAPSVAPAKTRSNTPIVHFAMRYSHNETKYETGGDSMEELMSAIEIIQRLKGSEGE